jgi:hypothetical protein
MSQLSGSIQTYSPHMLIRTWPTNSLAPWFPGKRGGTGDSPQRQVLRPMNKVL